MPPPLPPLNLSGLSDEELAEMEGNERHNVEARIHCLRNINTLLNASMVHIQQYMNICAATSHLDNLNKSKFKSGSASIQNDLKLLAEKVEKPSSTSATNESKVAFEDLGAAATTNDNEPSTNDIDSKLSPSDAGEADNDESDAIRRRRLQHFESSSSLQQ